MRKNPGSISIEEVKEVLRSASISSKIYVGCDSTQTKKFTVFVGVVILHIDGNKGCKIFPFVRQERRINSLLQRLGAETNFSMELALEVATVISPERIEVHFDFNPNPNHKSNAAVREALAYARGQGMIGRIKPDALAASSAGDFITRKERYNRV